MKSVESQELRTLLTSREFLFNKQRDHENEIRGALRPFGVAAVATARKLAVVIWHLLTKGESYVWARPSLYSKKLRDLELKAGHKAARGQKGAAHAFNIKSHREEERRWVEQAGTAYARFVAGWNASETGLLLPPMALSRGSPRGACGCAGS